MKQVATLLFFSALSLSSACAHADIIDDAIGNIQHAINDAYSQNGKSSDDEDRRYEDDRRRSDDQSRRYEERRRQLEDRRARLDERQRQLDRERRQLDDEERQLEEQF